MKQNSKDENENVTKVPFYSMCSNSERRDQSWSHYKYDKPVHTSLSSIQSCFHGGQCLEK